MSLKKFLRIVTVTVLGMYLTYSVYYTLTTERIPTYVDCGVVVSKSNDEVIIKHGSRTELYLNVQFDKTGFRSVNTDATTYFSKKIGDRVCFNLDQSISIGHLTTHSIGMITMVMLGIMIISLFIVYLTSNDEKQN